MNTTLVGINFLHSYIGGFLMLWLGLLLVNNEPHLKKIGFAALGYVFWGIFLRDILTLPIDISFLLQIVLLIMLVKLISHLSLSRSIIAVIMGVVVLFLGEMIFSIILINLFNPSIETSNNIFIILFIPLPQIVMTLIIIYLCIRYKFHLFDFEKVNFDSSAGYNNKRIKTTAGVVIILLMVIVEQITFNMSVINHKFNYFKMLPLTTIGIISTAILIVGVIATAFLIKQLVELTEKESQYYAQTIYIDTLDELYTAIRSERHDIVNHLQTIYGFNQLGYTQEVHNYLGELLGGNILSNEFIVTGTPGLTALFYIKSGIARINEIEFKVEVAQQIDNLKISSYELNNILGNLINNAFDAVMQLENKERIVNVNIGVADNRYIFKVSNYGYISDEIKKNIFRKGYSTKKDDHSGLGLHICANLVKKYGGQIEVDNNDNHMVEFSVSLPINIKKGELHESIGQKTGAFTG